MKIVQIAVKRINMQWVHVVIAELNGQSTAYYNNYNDKISHKDQEKYEEKLDFDDIKNTPGQQTVAWEKSYVRSDQKKLEGGVF